MSVFAFKTTGTLKFTLPIKENGNIALTNETAVSYKSFNLPLVNVPNVVADSEQHGWNALNYFLDSLIDQIFGTLHDQYANKITIEMETGGDD